MAKKKTKKRTSSKQSEEVVERSSFWPITGAVLLLIIAFLLLLGGFGTGGPLPLALFRGSYSVLGWVAYLIPVVIAGFGILKFRTEDNKIPSSKFFSLVALVLLASIWAHVAFVSSDAFGEPTGGHGGVVGKLVGGLTLNILDPLPASILSFVLAILMIFIAVGISIRDILDLVGIFKRSNKDDDTDFAELKSRASSNGFKLNEGVPIAHKLPKESVPVSSFKNTATKLAPDQDHAALTSVHDPDWKFPGIDLLNLKEEKAYPGNVQGNADIIEGTLGNFNIDVEMEEANVGPRVTQYTLRPPNGVKLAKITALENNLMLDLGATSIRMEAPIPGKRAVGIEVPNIKYATVRVSSILQSDQWIKLDKPLGFTIGKDITGTPVVGDLAKMPHLLIAGQTGSGKSVMINSIMTSLLYRNSPSDLKLILVDPKRVELKPYDDIPHLLTPVITEPEKCISALKWTVAEMERRYRALSEIGVKSIIEYNKKKQEEGMPYIVVVIDELADLMMMAARDVEALIVRIAQKARAVGIHLVLATQRPSVNVITGLIKANIPARIAFTVASQVDSRTITDRAGAEKLLGEGDMLLLTAEMPKPRRIQGAFMGDDETKRVTDFIRDQREPQYNDEIISQPVQIGKGGTVGSGVNDADDPLYKEAVRVVVESGKASTSALQRHLRVGYGKAARFMDTMEEQGIISAADGNRPREVLVGSLDEVYGGGETDNLRNALAMDAVLDENFPNE